MGEMKRIWVECREVAVELVGEYKLDSGRDVVSITNSLFAARVVQLGQVVIPLDQEMGMMGKATSMAKKKK